MGFNNVSYYDRIESVNKAQKEKMKNPYHAFSDTAKSVVTYYHINKPKTTLDEHVKSTYDTIGPHSPLRYDKLLQFPLYGLDKLLVDMEISEFGLQSRPLEGDAILLPNTIVPTPNDFFVVDYISHKLLFRVTNSTANNIENDNLMYKISYILDSTVKWDLIDHQVINTYKCISTGVENDYKLIIQSDAFDAAKDLELLMYKILNWYTDLFYNDRLEAFVLKHKNEYLYDEYLTEFIIRNRIISANEIGIHVMHQTNLPKTFSIDYEKTIFRFAETSKGDISEYIVKAYPSYINDLGSTLADRYYDYFRMCYVFDWVVYGNQTPVISVLNTNLIYHIESNTIDDYIGYQNLIIKHLHGEEITIEDLKYLENIDFKQNIEFFYNMPILVLILRKLCNSIINSKTLK